MKHIKKVSVQKAQISVIGDITGCIDNFVSVVTDAAKDLLECLFNFGVCPDE